MTRRRAVAYLLMLGAITKHLLSHEYGPWDRLIELGVFGLILYEVIVGIVRHRREKKRKTRLAFIVFELHQLMQEGRQIRDSAVADQGAQIAWMQAMIYWSDKTAVFLAKYLPTSLTAFHLVHDQPISLRSVRTKDGGHFNIGGVLLEGYETLSGKLANLRGIIEKVEAYF
jgi:hypothetical protein